MKKVLICAATALLLASLTACGGGMRLQRAQGDVTVSDSGGRELEAAENLALPSGCQVETHRDSSAWLDLETARLVKLDQDTWVELTREDSALALQVQSGGLFFRLPQAPDGGEAVTVRAFALTAELQGTGWVTVSAGGAMQIFLLDGSARFESGDSGQTIQAGETAFLTGDGTVIIGTFARGDIPAFVNEELEEGEDLLENIPEGGGPGWARTA